MFKLLLKAPKAFWTVGLVQLFCWAAFMFMWTYTNGTVALNVFDTPTVETMAEGTAKVVLDTQSIQYQNAADWVGILFAVQAIGSVIWAAVIPVIKNKKFAYVLSLVLGGIGFISVLFIHNQYALFNGTICIPQIVAASLGGMILKMFTTAGNVAPEVNMLVLAGIFLIIGAGCVGIIKEKQ